ncbi:MAG TPA: FAD-dependent oxidoreductase [Thauera sp.]|nr:FAD-dependent oxidoreductase [Thauera sp.]
MKRLVLAGAGHAHLHVLRTLGAARWPGVEVVLVTPYPRQIYSGMVPGWIAGHYRLEDCVAPVLPLAAAAGVRVVQDAVCAVDAERGHVTLAKGGRIDFDVLSLDTGAGLAMDEGLSDHPGLLPVRPLESFVTRWERALATLLDDAQARVAVIGGGAAGVELALAVAYRLRRETGAAVQRVTLACGGGLLPGHAPGVVKRARAALARQGVELVEQRVRAGTSALETEAGTPLAAAWVIAASGVGPPGWLAQSGLALAPDGFIAVGQGQQSVSHANVFAAGDAASRIDAPHAKSGVYAVRAGPVLSGNLRRALEGRPIEAYRPQRRSLYLLATGPREAIVSWGPVAASGRLAWRWKDWIDRRFMRQYQPASQRGQPT